MSLAGKVTTGVIMSCVTGLTKSRPRHRHQSSSQGDEHLTNTIPYLYTCDYVIRLTQHAGRGDRGSTNVAAASGISHVTSTVTVQVCNVHKL